MQRYFPLAISPRWRKSLGTMNGESFDLFRITNSKKTVDIGTTALRKWIKQGLPFYKRGKAVFISKTELAQFIKNGPPRK